MEQCISRRLSGPRFVGRYADFTLLIAVCRHQITSVSDHVSGIVTGDKWQYPWML